MANEPCLLQVDRSKKFDLTTFRFAWGVWNGSSIWKGSADGSGLEGEEDQDARSLAYTEFDLIKVKFETGLKNGEDERRIDIEERRRRLKVAGSIRLDALVFQALWENHDLLIERWNRRMRENFREIRFILFDGTVIRSQDGCRYALCMERCDDGFAPTCHSFTASPTNCVFAVLDQPL